MKCYYHPSIDSVGTCKNCCKGLCADCAADVGNGLACKNKCETEVNAINQMLERGKTSYIKTSNMFSNNAIIYAIMGILFLFFGLAIESRGSTFFVVFGCVMFLASLFQIINSKRFKSNK